MSSLILGISAFYHDSAACILRDGQILAAAQEERFSRIKHDSRFPTHAARYCLDAASATTSDLDYVVFYDKPVWKFMRLLETYLAYAPSGFQSYAAAIPVWLRSKLFLKDSLAIELDRLDEANSSAYELLFTEHHQSHAASAFFPSPYQSAAILTIDGVGEWATTTMGRGAGKDVSIDREIRFPHSLGMLYSAFTYYLGFKVNSGEYKVMGLAPYGEPRYVQTIYDHLIDLKQDGSFRLNMDYFDYCANLRMTSSRFDDLFGGPPREPEAALGQKQFDLARSVQVVIEEAVLRMANALQTETGEKDLCLAGGVALNCVANGRILRESSFDSVWIQPAAGDAGGAVGAALAAWHQYLGNDRTHDSSDSMRGAYLGPEYTDEDVETLLQRYQIPYQRMSDDRLFDEVSRYIDERSVVGWFQGRMEYGPRALGNRSILGDPRNPDMQSTMNLKIKFRESFRPFAPSVLRERAGDYFELDADSPYMLLVTEVNPERRITLSESDQTATGLDKLKIPRSEIPAVTHVDNTARVQTVDETVNPRYWRLIKAFEQRTGCGLLINTSFNVRGEPVVCTPEDALRCFRHTAMDYLVMGNIVVDKQEVPAWYVDESGDLDFQPD